MALSFLRTVAAPEGPLGFTAAAMRELRCHRWSGVHELRRVVEVAASICDGEVLDEMTVSFALKTGVSEWCVYQTDKVRRALDSADTYSTVYELDALQAV